MLTWIRKRGAGGAWQGFTLVELVIVIAVVGILAAIAIPRFINIRTEAYNSQRDAIVGSVRAGILTTSAQNQVNGTSAAKFPDDNLEDDWGNITGGTLEADGTACGTGKACFELVVPGGYTDGNWAQTTTTKYTFTSPVGGSTAYTYTPASGTFQ